MDKRCSQGFTLIELVVVILLLVIVSVYAASRYIGPDSFSTIAAQEQSIAIIRQIQLGRMQSNIDDSSTLSSRYQLTVSPLCLGSTQACTSSNTTINSNITDSAVLVGRDNLRFSPAIRIDFDLLGRPTCLTSCSSPIEIEINNDADSRKVCINQEGYVYGC